MSTLMMKKHRMTLNIARASYDLFFNFNKSQYSLHINLLNYQVLFGWRKRGITSEYLFFFKNNLFSKKREVMMHHNFDMLIKTYIVWSVPHPWTMRKLNNSLFVINYFLLVDITILNTVIDIPSSNTSAHTWIMSHGTKSTLMLLYIYN